MRRRDRRSPRQMSTIQRFCSSGQRQGSTCRGRRAPTRRALMRRAQGTVLPLLASDGTERRSPDVRTLRDSTSPNNSATFRGPSHNAAGLLVRYAIFQILSCTSLDTAPSLFSLSNFSLGLAGSAILASPCRGLGLIGCTETCSFRSCAELFGTPHGRRQEEWCRKRQKSKNSRCTATPHQCAFNFDITL